MPSFSVTAKDVMLNALSIATMSLHAAYDIAGGNEVTGGFPAYARLPVTFAAATLGTRILTGTPYTFNVPPTTVAWVGFWDFSSAFLGMTPYLGTPPRPFVVDDLAADTLKSATHGFLLGDSVVVWGGSTAVLPTGLSEGVMYFVVTPTTSTLQLATSVGGPAITLTTSGNGYLQRITSVVITGQGAFPINGLTLDATIVA